MRGAVCTRVSSLKPKLLANTGLTAWVGLATAKLTSKELKVGFGALHVHSGLEDCETHRKVTVLSTVAVTKSLSPFEWQYSPALSTVAFSAS